MKQMSSLDIFAITQELQDLIGYKVDNLYRDDSGRFLLFKLKGKGKLKNPFLLIEPGIRVHISELKYSVPERPDEKIKAIRGHLKGTLVNSIKQVDFDRLIDIELIGNQNYHLYIELFGSKPNFVLVGDENRVIFASWYRKMRHRDVLPGKEFELPPSRGKSILKISVDELREVVLAPENEKEEIVRVLARKIGGGGPLMEEILARAIIPKNKICSEIGEQNLSKIVEIGREIKRELDELKPSISLNSEEQPLDFHPIEFKSNPHKIKKFKSFSGALDYFYSHDAPVISPGLNRYQQKKNQLDKILSVQQDTLEKYKKQQDGYKKIGDAIYLQYSNIDEILQTLLRARKKNISWKEITHQLTKVKQKDPTLAQLLGKINSSKGTIQINLDVKTIEVDFRKTATEIANVYYEKAKKASRKIKPAEEAILVTQEKIGTLKQDIEEQTISDAITLKRRKRSWFEKYHWTISENNFLIIGGTDISSNDEVAKKRMKRDDLFFHADVQGAPYTILVKDSSKEKVTEEDINLAATLAASFSSAWKAGYGAIDVYYVPAENVSFSAPSGEYIPKGGVMVRGTRNYIRGVQLSLAIGYEEYEHNVRVIYGSEKQIKKYSPLVIIIKPGSVSKGKIAKQIQNIFIKKSISTEQKAKIKSLDLNEIVRAIPHDSTIADLIEPSRKDKS